MREYDERELTGKLVDEAIKTLKNKKRYKAKGIFLSIAVVLAFISGLSIRDLIKKTERPAKPEFDYNDKEKTKPITAVPTPKETRIEIDHSKIKLVYQNIRAIAPVEITQTYDLSKKVFSVNTDSTLAKDIDKLFGENISAYLAKGDILLGYDYGENTPAIDAITDHNKKLIKVYMPKVDIIRITIDEVSNVGEKRGLVIQNKSEDDQDAIRNQVEKDAKKEISKRYNECVNGNGIVEEKEFKLSIAEAIDKARRAYESEVLAAYTNLFGLSPELKEQYEGYSVVFLPSYLKN